MGTQPFAGFAEQGPTQVIPPSSQNVSSEIPAQDSSGRNSLPEAASPSTTRCKYGRRCTRENCWFLHPEGRSIDNKRKALAEGSEPEASLPKRRPYDDAESPPKEPLHTPPSDSSPEPAGNSIGKPMPADLHTGVHSRLREVVPEWPRVITPSGKLKDKKLEGQGWPLHFLHPDFPRSVISLEDVQAVVSTLRRQGMGALGTARVSSPGVIQVPLGLQRKGGNLTGLIKANIPTRIGFQVSTKIDSRTILDQGGAEQLLGYGDMLYLPPGVGVPIRVHGAFVGDDEVHRVVNDWKSRAEPEYIDDIVSSAQETGPIPGWSGSENSSSEDSDDLYDEAVSFVLESRRASISAVQRKLRIGYNRAARLIESMEEAGLVSEMSSNGSREVLVPKRD